MKITTVDHDDRIVVTIRGENVRAQRTHMKVKGQKFHHSLAASRTAREVLHDRQVKVVETGTNPRKGITGYTYEVR